MGFFMLLLNSLAVAGNKFLMKSYIVSVNLLHEPITISIKNFICFMINFTSNSNQGLSYINNSTKNYRYENLIQYRLPHKLG